jgi:hypothetical protein
VRSTSRRQVSQVIWLLTGLVLGLSAISAKAEGPKVGPDPGPVFGPEFTFSREGATSQDLVEHMKKHLVQSQPQGEKFEYQPKPTVSRAATFTSPNGWTVSVMNDGVAVVEVTMRPMVVDDFERFSSDIQDAIFVSAQKLDMWPAPFRGGGHINMDLNYFRDRPILLRNFLVDQVNHSELSLGIMNYDTNNAVPIATTGLLDEFKRAIRTFDAEIAQKIIPEDPDPLTALMKILNHRFGTTDSDYNSFWGNDWRRVFKSSSLAFYNSVIQPNPTGHRIEIRAVRPQASLNTWIRQIKLIRDRLRYLDRTFGNQLIPIDIRVAILPTSLSERKLIPPVNPQDAFREFYIFVQESGHQWSDHRDYLWPVWTFRQEDQSSSELERFESSPWFRAQEQLQSGECKTLLSAASGAR